jgi:hypothetical protein
VLRICRFDAAEFDLLSLPEVHGCLIPELLNG